MPIRKKVKCCSKNTENVIFLKAAVGLEHSLSVSQPKHTAWVMLKERGVVEAEGCSNIAGLGCSYSVEGIHKPKHLLSIGTIKIFTKILMNWKGYMLKGYIRFMVNSNVDNKWRNEKILQI